MFAPTEVTNRYLQKHIPAEFRGLRYTKVTAGEERTIVKVAYSTYEAVSPEGDPILRKSGEPVVRTTAYIAFDDGTYTTSHGDTVLSQLESETGPIGEQIGVIVFDVDCPVRITTIKVVYGRGVKAKQYDTWAFEPM